MQIQTFKIAVMKKAKIFFFIFLGLFVACAQESPEEAPEDKGLKPEELFEGKGRINVDSSWKDTVVSDSLFGGMPFAVLSVRKEQTKADNSRKDSAVTDSLPSGMLLAGIVRWDGIIAPFGAFDGSDWELPQRGWLENRAQPVSWHIVSRKGTKWQVQGKGSVTPDGCFMYEQWGQQVDFPPDTVHWSEFFDTKEELKWANYESACPVSRIGLALNDDTHSIKVMEASSEDEKESLLAQIRPVFEEAEAKRIMQLNRDTSDTSRIRWGHPVSADERSSLPVELELLEHIDVQKKGIRLYHYKAHRTYAPVERRGYSCPTKTRLQGLVIASGEHYRVLDASLGMQGACSDSPGLSEPAAKPLGMLTIGEKSFLLSIESGYESSIPVILEINSDGMQKVLKGWEEYM